MSPSLFKTVLLVGCLVTSFSQPAVAQSDVAPTAREPLTLSVCDLAAGTQPESQLPVGAIAHARINGLRSLLDDTSAMAFPFVPEKMVGQPAIFASQQENPMLALIGIMAMGGPLDVDQLSALSGIDPARPVTLSYYFMGPASTFALSVPVNNLDAVAGLLTNMMDRNVPAREVQVAGATVQHIVIGGVDAFVLASADRIWVTGRLPLVEAILGDNLPRMDESGIIPDMIAEHAGDNLLVVLDPEPVKPLLGFANQYRTLPSGLVQSLRGEVENNIRGRSREEFERMLRDNLGIADITEALDYVECIALGIYEPVVGKLLDSIEQVNGAVVAVDLDKEFQRLHFSLHSGDIVAAAKGESLSIAQINDVVKRIPGSRNRVVLSAKTATPEKSELLSKIISNIRDLMRDKELPMDLHEKIHRLWNGYHPVTPLSSRVDWLAHTSYFSGRNPSEFDRLSDFIEQGMQETPYVNLEICPPQADGFIEDHFLKTARQVTSNSENWRRFMLDMGSTSSISQHSESSANKLAGDVKQLIYQDHYLLHYGFFGYQQHELINRQFTLMRQLPDQTVLWRGGTNADLMANLTSNDEITPAIDRLLSQSRMPDSVQRVEVTRMAGSVVGLVDWLGELETLVHDELDSYLGRSQKILDDYEGNDRNELRLLLAANEMPMLVSELVAIDQRLLLVTPVGLTYPRPKVVPEIEALLEDHRVASETAGGALAFSRTADGRFDTTAMLSTAAASNLTRSVGNAIADRYLANPDAMEQLKGKLIIDQDREARNATEVIANESWRSAEMLNEIIRMIEREF